jgi:hypothetical protein
MSDFDNLAICIGYVVLAVGGAAGVALCLIGLCLLSNRLQNHMIDTLGGWKVFMEYRDWYHERQRNKLIPPSNWIYASTERASEQADAAMGEARKGGEQP